MRLSFGKCEPVYWELPRGRVNGWRVLLVWIDGRPSGRLTKIPGGHAR